MDVKIALRLRLHALYRALTTEPWQTPLSVACGAHVALYVLITFFVGLFPGEPASKPGFWAAMAQWDGEWYLRIATEGYKWLGPTVQSAVVFFPIYPLLGKIAGMLVGDIHWGMLIVTNVSCVLYFYYLYRLTAEEFDAGTAERAVVYAGVFPAAFVLASFYSEATSFALAVAAFYYARRGRWPLAIVLGCLTTASRFAGISIVFPLAYEYWRQRGLNRQALAIGLVPLGLIAFAVYVWWLSGDPFTLVTVEHTAWFHSFTPPWETIRLALDRARWPLQHYVVSVSLLDAGSILLFIGLTVWTMLKLPPAYWLYALPILIGALSQTVDPQKAPPTQSISRYLMAMFPAYIALAQAARNRILDQTVRWTFAILMGVFAIYFFSRYWVA